MSRRRLLFRVLLGLTAAGGLLAGIGLWFMGKPLFQQGSVAGMQDLQPAPDATPAHWEVSPGIVLAHHTQGEGAPILVVHGGPGIAPTLPAPAWRQLEGWAVHSYDQRGTGASTRPISGFEGSSVWTNIKALEGALGIQQQLADIERVRRILGEEQLTLIGHSYGGLLAALYAAEMPDKVKQLVLISPADLLVFPSPRDDLFTSLRSRLPTEHHTAFDTWLKDYLDLPGAFGRSEEELASLDSQLTAFWADALGPIPEAVNPPASHLGVWHPRAQFLSMGMRHDWSKALAAVHAPVLVLHGEDDLQSPDVARMYADAFPSGRVEVIDGAGHYGHYTHPEQVASVVSEFLASP